MRMRLPETKMIFPIEDYGDLLIMREFGIDTSKPIPVSCVAVMPTSMCMADGSDHQGRDDEISFCFRLESGGIFSWIPYPEEQAFLPRIKKCMEGLVAEIIFIEFNKRIKNESAKRILSALKEDKIQANTVMKDPICFDVVKDNEDFKYFCKQKPRMKNGKPFGTDEKTISRYITRAFYMRNGLSLMEANKELFKRYPELIINHMRIQSSEQLKDASKQENRRLDRTIYRQERKSFDKKS